MPLLLGWAFELFDGLDFACSAMWSNADAWRALSEVQCSFAECLDVCSLRMQHCLESGRYYISGWDSDC